MSLHFQKQQRATFTQVLKQEDGKYFCPRGNCGKEFTSAMFLILHQLADKHLDRLCCVCNKTFSQKHHLRRHIKSVHLQEQHVCSQCPDQRSFTRTDALYAHQLMHHGMIICNYCGAGFGEAKWLKDHVSKYHAN